MKTLKKGSLIEYVDSFGHGNTRQAKIESIERVPYGEKYGDSVTEANFDDVQKSDQYVIDLDNGKWAYGHQIKALIE